MKVLSERTAQSWFAEVDGKDYRIVYNTHKRPPRFYSTLEIYSRVGIHAGAKPLQDTSPVYKKVRQAWLQHNGGWPR